MTIRFDAKPRTIDRWTVLRLPEAASRKLPSRGQVAVEATLNGRRFQTVLEPDGRSGHWMRLDHRRSAADTLIVEVEPLKDWPEPDLPEDLRVALAEAPPSIRDIWSDITPMARWEWVRWINATRNVETRRRRVEVTISKLQNGKRRPCCFNLAACTDPDLSRNGKLVDAVSGD